MKPGPTWLNPFGVRVSAVARDSVRNALIGPSEKCG
jgi:hypothetical protein